VSANAQSYPSRPITIIVPFPPGGPVDTIGRIIGDRMRASFGQPVIIENQPGASGSIGVGRAARAAPDGYTLNLGNWTSHVGSPAIYPVSYDIVKDFEPVALLPIAPTLIVGKKALPASDLRELIACSRPTPTRRPPARSASAARRMSAASISRTRPAPASSSCRIAAAPR
jgi:tripartite-type tricarboxylate transporter receptor subunit TctC